MTAPRTAAGRAHTFHDWEWRCRDCGEVQPDIEAEAAAPLESALRALVEALGKHWMDDGVWLLDGETLNAYLAARAALRATDAAKGVEG